MAALSKYNQILINCVNDDERSQCDLEKKIASNNLDWKKLIELSRNHGVAPILFKNTSAFNIPIESTAMLRGDYESSLLRSLIDRHNLKHMLIELRKADIEVILLKGAALSDALYKDVTLRPCCDFDLLVKEESWNKICDILRNNDFSNASAELMPPPKLTKYDIYGHMHFVNKNGTNLEFQFDLFQLGLGIKSIDDVWLSAEEIEFEGVLVKTLSPEYQLVHLCTHLNKHGYRRLIWFFDIAKLIQMAPINWPVVKKISKLEGVLPSVYFTLLYTNELFEGVVKTDVLRSLKPSWFKQIVWKRIWVAEEIRQFQAKHEAAMIFRQEIRGQWFISNMIITGRALDKIHYLVRKIFPPFSFIEKKYVNYSKGTNILFYLKNYLFRIKNKFGTEVKKPHYRSEDR